MRRTNIVFQSKKSHRLMALALSAVVGLTATFAAAETVTPTGNTYGFAGTNARQDRLIDAFLYASVTHAYLTAALDAL